MNENNTNQNSFEMPVGLLAFVPFDVEDMKTESQTDGTNFDKLLFQEAVNHYAEHKFNTHPEAIALSATFDPSFDDEAFDAYVQAQAALTIKIVGQDPLIQSWTKMIQDMAD